MTEQRAGQVFSAFFPLGTALILIVSTGPRWLMALRYGPYSPSLQSSLHSRCCPREAAAWPPPGRIGRGWPNPKILASTGGWLVFCSIVLFEIKGQYLSLYLSLVKQRACVFDQESFNCFEHNLYTYHCSTQSNDPSEYPLVTMELCLCRSFLCMVLFGSLQTS